MGREESEVPHIFVGPDGPIFPEEFLDIGPQQPIQEAANELAKQLGLKPGQMLMGADGPIGLVREEGHVMLIQELLKVI